MSFISPRVAAFAATAILATSHAFADDPPSVEKLTGQLTDQAQRIQVLERKLELQNEANQAASSSAAVPKAGPKGFSIASADGSSVVKFRGTLHFDGRFFPDDITPETADTWLLRRVRPTIEGTIAKIYDFRFTPDFAGGRAFLLDAYAAARFKPWFIVQGGKFKVPVGLERLVSANDIRFIERAYPTNLLPNRDLGVQITGDVAGGRLNYSLGYFNGVTDGSSADTGTPADAETDTVGDIAARIFVQPFLNSDVFALRGLGFGVAGTYVDVAGNPATPNLSTYRTAGQQTLFQYRANTATAPLNNATYADGVRRRITPQAYYYLGSFGVLTEYAQVKQDVSRQLTTTTRASDTLETSAWHVQLSWFITGEEETYKGFTPNSTLQIGKSGWGAFELVARAHSIDFDDKAFAGGANSFANPVGKVGKTSGAINPRKATSVGVGLNWYFNEAFKWQVDYEVTKFDGGAVGGADQPDEKAILTRFAVGF
jgi:phosphate-selective porin OprO/OprP